MSADIFTEETSELASTVKTPGAKGAIVYAVETTVGTSLAVDALLSAHEAVLESVFPTKASEPPGAPAPIAINGDLSSITEKST